jgi:hypothetical protein
VSGILGLGVVSEIINFSEIGIIYNLPADCAPGASLGLAGAVGALGAAENSTALLGRETRETR